MSTKNMRGWFERVVEFLNTIRDSRGVYEPIHYEPWQTIKPNDFKAKYEAVIIPSFGLNRNGRLFTREIAQKMCDMFDPKQTNVGEIGHPHSAIVSLFDASHRIHKVFIRDNSLWAEFSVMNNDAGRRLYQLFNDLGMDSFILSPRGFGSIDHAGRLREDYKVITYDFISVDESAFRPYTEEEVKEKGVELFREEALWNAWYDIPNYNFGNRTPRSIVDEGRAPEVIAHIEDISHGIMS
jgi:hypothetical protein